jgi:hypothetical protein
LAAPIVATVDPVATIDGGQGVIETDRVSRRALG